MTQFDPETFRAEAQQCFRSSFNGSLVVICLADQRYGKSENPDMLSILNIDGHKTPPAISLQTTNPPPSSSQPQIDDQCVWRASHQVLQRIFLGDRQLTSAYISGRLIISGDMAVMARLKLTESASMQPQQ